MRVTAATPRHSGASTALSSADPFAKKAFTWSSASRRQNSEGYASKPLVLKEPAGQRPEVLLWLPRGWVHRRPNPSNPGSTPASMVRLRAGHPSMH